MLVVSQPTWGVDAGAAAAIHQALVDLAAKGSAVVVISQDLDELLALCRPARGASTRAGCRAARRRRALGIEEIGLLMGGIHGAGADRRSQRSMLEWRRRREPSTAMLYLSPLLAVVLTMLLGMLIFT